MLLTLCAMCVVLLVPHTARAQVTRMEPTSAPAGAPRPESRPPDAPHGSDVRRLTVHPRAPDRPALKHRLLPDVVDTTPGNAAPLYLMAFLQAAQVPESARSFGPEQMGRLAPRPESPDRADYYLNAVPLDQVTQQGAEDYLRTGHFSSALEFMDLAGRREYCRWDTSLPERGFYALLPHLTYARMTANHLALRARLQVARRDYDGAVRTLQTTFALARDLNEQSVLVQALVGAGVASQSVRGVEELVQQPDAPNLYWPLADLPRPFTQIHGAMEHERAAVCDTLPQLRRVRPAAGGTGGAGGGGTFSADDWRDVVKGMAGFASAVRETEPTAAPGDAGPAGDVGAVLMGAALYPRAKQFLIDNGMPAGQAEAMPVAAVLGRYLVDTYERWYDEMLKWTALPYWQGQDGAARALDEFRLARERFPGNPLLDVIPAVQGAYFVGARVDRDLAAAQLVEAIRAYAAAHDGAPPPRLADLADTPAPPDPTTGEPFVYRVDGNRATIESPAPPGQVPQRALRVEVTLVK